MKTIFLVAKTELKTLFYSPIAWFLIVIFMVQVGLAYVTGMDDSARLQEGGFNINFSVVSGLFFGARGVYAVVIQNLYLYLPLLTMGLISRETSSGTIRLLYSSPIRVREIVLGKFGSMMVINGILVAIVGLLVVLTHVFVISPDTARLLSGLLGLYLLLCAYSAIGLFMSSLTNYQIVAAVCTFVTIWCLYAVGGLWQGIEFVRNLTYFLSVAGRTDNMLLGLITTKDLIYFGVIIFMFLILAILKLKAAMESKPPAIRYGRYGLTIAITLAIGYISSIPNLIGYWDVTADKSNTITPGAQKILAELGDDDLEVHAYANLLGGFFNFGNPESYNLTLRKWEPYMRFKHNIKLSNVLYYDTLTLESPFMKDQKGKKFTDVISKVAENFDMKLDDFIGPDSVRKLINLSDEPNWYAMQLRYKGKTTMLRVFNDNEQWPTETEVSAAIKRLLKAKLPKVLFATGEFERSIGKLGDREYRALTNLKSFRNSLLNQGFDVDTISLSASPIPKDISTLVIADPKIALSPEATAHLQAYIDAGGNLMILGEPGKQDLVNPLIKQFGVQLTNGTLIEYSRDLQPELATPYLTSFGASLYPRLKNADKDSAVVSMPGATALTFLDSGTYSIKPLLVTKPHKGWLKKGRVVTDSAAIFFMPENGDERNAFVTAAGLVRQKNGREQRIVIAGDADFMANTELQRFNLRTANFAFCTGLFSWMNYGEFPIDSSRPPVKDTKLLITKDQVKTPRIVLIWILPILVVITAAILLTRRKRK
jgi:ABC-2 type transport system permease protein